MANATRALARTKGYPAYDPNDIAGYYAVRLDGACCEPELADGAKLLVDTEAPCRMGDFVIVHLRPEAVRNGDARPLCKRLIIMQRPPKEGTPPHLQSNIAPCVIVEQLNPPRTYTFPWEYVEAVHKVLGPVPPHIRTYKAGLADVRRLARPKAEERVSVAATGDVK